MPDDTSILKAQPIWFTAKRQGFRALPVLDWPMAHGQTGPYKRPLLEKFDRNMTDEQRLTLVAKTLQDDAATKQPPPRLIMTYMSNVDTVGHRSGPDSAEVHCAVLEADATLGKLIESVTTWFDATHGRNDELYVVVSTDHGMEQVHTRVSLGRIVGSDMLNGARITTGGPLAMVYLTDLPRISAPRAAQIVAKLRTEQFISCWTTNDIPANLHFADPTGIGQVVVLLPAGYVWTTAEQATPTQPVTAGTTPGAHGYDPSTCPTMFGGDCLAVSAPPWRSGYGRDPQHAMARHRRTSARHPTCTRCRPQADPTPWYRVTGCKAAKLLRRRSQQIQVLTPNDHQSSPGR